MTRSLDGLGKPLDEETGESWSTEACSVQNMLMFVEADFLQNRTNTVPHLFKKKKYCIM